MRKGRLDIRQLEIAFLQGPQNLLVIMMLTLKGGPQVQSQAQTQSSLFVNLEDLRRSLKMMRIPQLLAVRMRRLLGVDGVANRGILLLLELNPLLLVDTAPDF